MKFLQENGLDPHALDAETLLGAFREEMRRGLRGQGPLPMLPAGFPLRDAPPKTCEIPAFDVGGTNIRSARIHFAASGAPSVRNLVRGAMPGARGRVSEEEFYGALCDALLPNLRAGERFGFCFSYPVTPEGELLFWTKGIQAPDIPGTNVLEGMVRRLAARGCPNAGARILNDTVAALLAAYAHPATRPLAGHVGFILGTGTNTAYAEAAEAIVKCPDLPAGTRIPVNCESGNFARFPRSRFDERYEALNGNGRAQWERCISGVHLGPLGTLVLRTAAEEGLFAGGLRDTLLARDFSNIELDAFCAGQRPDLLPCSGAEAQRIRELLCPMYERAARFAAVNIAAAALASAEAQGSQGGLIRVNADGSTFWKTACVPFVDIVSRQLRALLEPRGFDFELVRLEDAPLIGAALAAC